MGFLTSIVLSGIALGSSSNSTGLQCDDITSQPSEEQCAFAQEHCGDDSIINYEAFYHCSSSDWKPMSLVVLVVYLLYTIMLLASTADNFFVIELQTLASILKLSDDVAGVTLLALGNGAPDIFTAVVGLGQDDFQLALSDLMGGGIFINTIVLGSVLLVTAPGKLEVDKKPFLRDLGMYVLCTLAVFFVSIDGKVDMLEALAFIVGYVGYIVFVLVTAVDESDADADADADGVEGGGMGMGMGMGMDKDMDVDTDMRLSTALLSDSSMEAGAAPKKAKSLDGASTTLTTFPGFRPSNVNHIQRNSHTSRESFRQYSLAAHFIHHTSPTAEDDSRLLGFNDYPSVSEDGYASTILWWLEYPLSVLRHLSIPSADPFWDKNRRILSSVSPVLSFQLIILAAKGVAAFKYTLPHVNINLSLAAFVLSVIISIALWVTSNNDHQPKYFTVSVLYAFVMSIVWLDLIANEIVALLETLGLLMGVGTSILGLTVLAWGNSVGDLVADTATAKAGKVKTAIASCFGSPLLSALVGLGIALTVTTGQEHGSVATTIDTQNFFAMMTLLFTLFTSGVVFWKCNFKPPRGYAYFLFAVYFVFLVVSCLLEALKK
jgi:sodium/potassium/calcium exchanger 6